jgi:hypothetical protein
MEYVLLVGLVMVAFNIFMSYIELKPFLRACEDEKANANSLSSRMVFPFKIIGHLPKLIPSITDILAMIAFTQLFDLGSGYAGGITGLFASNILSIIIYFYIRRHGHKQETQTA